MKQHQLNVLLCALILFAISPLMALANNEDVLMELTPKRVEVGETPINFYDDGGPNGQTSPEFKEGKTSSVTFVPTITGKKVQVDFSKVDIFEGSQYKQFIEVYDGTEVRADRLLATVRKGTTPLLKATNAEGALTVVFGSTTAFRSNGFQAVVSLFVPQAMQFSEVVTSSMQDHTLAAGESLQPLLAFSIRTTETEPALALHALTVNNSGPITGLRLYQSASENDLSTAHCIAKAEVSSQQTVLNVTNKPALRMGNNFYFIACDVSEEAENGNTVSVSLTQVALSDAQHALNATLLTGDRLVENIIYATEGTQIKRVNGELTLKSKSNTYNDNYEGGNQNRIVSFKPLHQGRVVQIDFSKFDVQYSSSTAYGVRAHFVVYEGVGTTGRKLWELNSSADRQRGPGKTLRSKSPDGALTIVFNPKDSHYSAKGFEAKVSEYQPKHMTLTDVVVQQASTEGVAPGAKQQPLLLVNLKTEGDLQPITLQSLLLDLKNSMPAMSALQLFKQPAANPGAAPSTDTLAIVPQSLLQAQQHIALTQPLTLDEGDNWLMICADVAAEAQAKKALDAALLKVNTSLGETQVQAGDPIGERLVEYERSLVKGDNGRIDVPENATFTLYDDGGKDKNESKNFDGIITFVPKTPGTIIAIKANTWTLAAPDKLEVYFGTARKDKPDLVFDRYKKLEKLLSTAPDGAITLRYTTGKYAVSEGFALEVSAITPQSLSISKVNVTAVAPEQVFKAQENVPMLHVEVTVTGDKGQLQLTQMRAPWPSTSPVAQANVFATALNNGFATTTNVGSTNANDGVFAMNYTIEKAGEYHFWVAMNVAPTATVGQTLSVALTDVTANATAVQPISLQTASTNVAQGISGTINVGPSTTYTTIQSAIEHLKTGIDGPVTLSIEKGEYNERVNIPHLPGLSSTNTLTLKAASGKRGDVHIFHNNFTKNGYDPDQMANDYGVVTIDGATHTTLQALEISTQDPTYPGVVHLRNKSRNITIDNCYIHAPLSTSIQQKVTLVNLYAKNEANANNDHFSLQHSLLEGGYNGVRLGGTGFVSLPAEIGGRIVNNVLRNQGTKAIYVAREVDARVEGNTIENELSTHKDFSAIDIDAKGDVRVVNNRISLNTKEYCTALFVRNVSGTPASLALIANNAVSVKHAESSSRSYGSKVLSLKGGSENLLIAHNTLCVEGKENDITVAVMGAMNGKVQMVNNILQNNGKGLVYQTTRKEFVDSLALSHNNLFTNGNQLAKVQSSFADFNEWRTLAGEKFAYNKKVDFATDVLLQPLTEDDLRHGKPISTIATDLLGVTRSASTPLIGAYEQAWQPTPTGITTAANTSANIVLQVENGALNFTHVPQGAQIEVFSVAGALLSRHVLPANATSLQVQGLPKGVFMVRVRWANGRWSTTIKK